MKINELLQRQREVVDKAKNEGGRALTAEEQTEFDALQRQIDELAKGDGQAASAGEESGGAEGAQADETRKRCGEIVALCREFNEDPLPHIEKGHTVEQVREAIMNGMIRRGEPLGVSVTRDEGDKFRAAASDALLMRAGMEPEKAAEGAKELRGLSLREFAVECLSREGTSGAMRMSNDELWQRMFFNPTAAFPAILDQTIRKAYMDGYTKSGMLFDRWTSKGTLSDFKESNAGYLVGAAGEFLQVPESGELKADAPKDHLQPKRKLETYGRQFSMSRQAFINDDIGYLTTIPARYAAAARKTINKQVYSILMKNPAIYDGVQLFNDANHHNHISSGTALTAENLQKAIYKLQLQTDQDGDAIINRPAYLIVPIGMEMTAYSLLKSATINTAGNTQAANPLAALNIEVIADSTINVLGGVGALPWFLVADKMDSKSIQVDYLNGQEIPTILRKEAAGQLGYMWDVFLDWGITVLDYRGIVKNDGVSLGL